MHNYCLLCFVNCHHSWHLFNNYKRKKWRTIFCIEKKYTPLWKIIPLSQAFFERHEGMQNPISAFSNPILCSLFLQKKKYPIFEKNVIILLSWWMLRFWPRWWTQNQCKQENDAQEKFMNQDGEEKRDLHYYSIYKKKNSNNKKRRNLMVLPCMFYWYSWTRINEQFSNNNRFVLNLITNLTYCWDSILQGSDTIYKNIQAKWQYILWCK